MNIFDKRRMLARAGVEPPKRDFSGRELFGPGLFISICWYIYSMTSRPVRERLDAVERAFRRRDGILRTSEALDSGIYPRTLYAMRDAATRLSPHQAELVLW